MSAKAYQHFINHVIFVVDDSGSMGMHRNVVPRVFDSQIANLKKKSVELDQETRASIYFFGTHIDNLVFDMDVERAKSITGYYTANQSSTALIAATLKVIADQRLMPELYGDHAVLIIVLTDGGENSGGSAEQLRRTLQSLPGNYTVAVMVPDNNGASAAERYGFSRKNIAIWNATSSDGVTKVGEVFTSAVNNYMTGRSLGVRGSSTFFKVDPKLVTKKDLKSSKDVNELTGAEYETVLVRKLPRGQTKWEIKPVVEDWTGQPYRNGSAYYQLVKKEKAVQASKNLILRDRISGKVFAGPGVRQILGLPAHDVPVEPADHKTWDIFVQSTSVNRILPEHTSVIVLK